MSVATISRRQSALLFGACYGVLSLWFCAPLFEHPNAPGINDWDQHLFYYASVLKNVVEYGQLPFWNPWYCGGNVLWANPQVPLLSPVFPLTAIVSLPLAMKISIVLHYWVGLVGMHLLLRSLGLRSLAWTVYLTVVAICSGAMALHLNVGHSVFLPCLYIPLQLHFTLRAIREGRLKYVSGAAMLLALMIYNGALHAVPMSVAALGLFAAMLAILERRWRPLVVAGAVLGLGFAFAGPKLLPVVHWVTSDRFVDARTVLQRPDQMTAEMVARAYLDRFQHRSLRFDMQRSGWFEYGNYLGGLAALLIAASVAWTLGVRGTRGRSLGVGLAVTAVALFALSVGEFSWWAPASLATHVPLFSSFRIPSRYTIVFVIMGIATVGWVVRCLEGEITLTRGASLWIGIVLMLAAADVVQQNRGQFRGVFPYEPLASGFKLRGGVRTLDVDTTGDPYVSDAPMLRVLMRDRTFFNCYESLQTTRSARPDAALVAVEGEGQLFDMAFSPNHVGFSVAAGRDRTHVVMNQNFALGWRSSAGTVVRSPSDGRPSVDLGVGQAGRFEFSYVPPGLVAGSGLLIVAIGLALVTWTRRLPGGEDAEEG